MIEKKNYKYKINDTFKTETHQPFNADVSFPQKKKSNFAFQLKLYILQYTKVFCNCSFFLFIVLAYLTLPDCDSHYGYVRYVKSIRGNIMLQLNGQCYTLNRRKHHTSYWECLKKRSRLTKCTSRIVTIDGQIKSMRGLHNH